MKDRTQVHFSPSLAHTWILRIIRNGLLMTVLTICFLTCAAVGTSRGQDRSVTTGQYLVEFNGQSLPANLSARVTALGGTIIDTMPEIKVAIIGNITDSAAVTLRSQRDIADVTADELLSPVSRLSRPGVNFAQLPMSETNPATAIGYPFQWHMRVVGADRAWQAGYLGNPDVRIAIIDTGIDPAHPDLVGRIDESRSRSFCTDEDPLVAREFPGYPSWTDLYGHGTFVASVAASNGHFVGGVTSQTTLMAIKALGIVPCHWSSTIRGIYYAADHGADVLNISSGTYIRRHLSARNFRYYLRAVQYALGRGVSAIVVSAGNSAVDLDRDMDLTALYCDVPGVICVSATGPTDSGPDFLGPWPNIDSPAFYTNFGSSAITVAAPGRNVSFNTSGNVTGISYVTGACATTDRMFDANGHLVPGICSSGPYYFAGNIGTSFAAPHVSGLAALLVSKFGHGQSAQIEAAIENSADDLGKPGVDPFYGRGRINGARALAVP